MILNIQNLLTKDYIIASLSYLISGMILLFVGKIAFQLFHPGYKSDDQMVEKDNFAFAIAKAGYYVGILFTIISALFGESKGLKEDLLAIGAYGGLGIILLNVSMFINDKLILRKFSVKKELLEDQNAGTGVIVAASSIATGIILYDALTADAADIPHAIAYWGIAQVLLIISTIIYTLIIPYKVHELVEKDNVAAGVGFAGAIIALANIIGFAINQEFGSWSKVIIESLIFTGIGIVLLPFARFLTDKILLPKRSLTDEIANQEKPNVGAALIEAFAYIGGSVVIISIL